GAVIALAVAVAEGPPAPGHQVVEALVVRMAVAVADRIAAGAQDQLIAQAQRAVPVEPEAPLLLAGAGLTLVVATGTHAPGLGGLTVHLHPTAAHFLPRRQLDLRATRRQAIELVDHLLQLAQVQALAGRARKGHADLGIARPAVAALEAF